MPNDDSIQPLIDDENDDLLSQEASSSNDDQDKLDEAFFTSPTVEWDREPQSQRKLIGLLSPGTYWILKARINIGVGLNLFLALSVLFSSLSCIYWQIFPIPMAITVLLLIVLFWLFGFVQTFRSPKHLLANWPTGAIVGIAFLSFWLPLLLSSYITTNFVIQRTWMSNETMAPGIMKGDIILVDKISHLFSPPSYGDLVLVEEEYEDNGNNKKRVYFGRIIACSDDIIQLVSSQPSVNKKQLSQFYHLKNASVPNDTSESELDGIAYEIPADVHIESLDTEPERWYPVLAPKQILYTSSQKVRLAEDHYYLLEDNRLYYQHEDSKRYGVIIHKSQIRGTPRYVFYNTEMEHPFERYGIVLR